MLFAISQRHAFLNDKRRPGLSDVEYRFRETTFDVATFIAKNADTILGVWKKKGTMNHNATKLSNSDGVPGIANYGCIQLGFGDVETMVKTRFSLGGYKCTDTDPGLYSLD